jgi:hypothetical protein
MRGERERDREREHYLFGLEYSYDDVVKLIYVKTPTTNEYLVRGRHDQA